MLAGSFLVGASCRRNAFGVSAVLAKLRWSAGVVSNPAAPTLVELGNVLFRGAMTFYTTTGVLPRS